MNSTADAAAAKKRIASSSSSSTVARARPPRILSLSSDLLCAIFSLLNHLQLIRCSAVCKSWNNIIFRSTLMRDLYYTRHHAHVRGNPNVPVPSEASMRQILADLAMEQHRLGFLGGSCEVHQWNAHSVRINICRMKRGLILTGAEDKVLRLWSAESYKCSDEYSIPNKNPLIDYDFDENKIVGLASTQMCILRRNGKGSTFQLREGCFSRGLCMRYIDPEAVIGCDDGRARVLDMYSGSCSRIIRMHGGPITCMTLTEDQLIFGGSTFGTIAVADLSTGVLLASLKSSFTPTGMKCLDLNMGSHLLFAGSTSGYAHCWDLRTLRPLWEARISPNAIYSAHHLSNDTSTLAVGGLDGVLRLLDQNTGEVLSRYVTDSSAPLVSSAKRNRLEVIENRMARSLADNVSVDSIPSSVRPPITSIAVGLNKIVTTHNEKYIRVWRFHREIGHLI